VNTESSIDCSDLYDNAAERLKRLDNDIDNIIQDLAKKVEARGVPKNKVARQVVKELTAREVLSKSRIYEGLGSEQKRKYKKREIEETFPQAEIFLQKNLLQINWLYK
jgi:DNA-binding ferritin-like protein